MKKISVLAIFVILLIGGLYIVFKNKKVKNSPQVVVPEATSQSLKDLLALDKSQKCTYTLIHESVSSDGTLFFKDKKLRGDFKTVTEDKIQQSHMIIDENAYYVWVDGQPQGLKMTIDLNAAIPDTDSTGQPIDWNQKIDYSCTDWTIDSSQFTIPSDVNFVEYTKETTCGLCNSLPTDQKLPCLRSLGCTD